MAGPRDRRRRRRPGRGRAAAHALRPRSPRTSPRRCSRAGRHSTGSAPTSSAVHVLTRLLYGPGSTCGSRFLAVLFPFVLGTVLGTLAGYFGGGVDAVIMRARRRRGRLPVLRAGHRAGLRARPGRAQHLHRDHRRGLGRPTRGSSAARSSWPSGRTTCWRPAREGCPTPRIMSRHLLPNVITQAIIYAMSDIVHGHHGDRHPGLSRPRHPAADRGVGPMIIDGQEFITTHWQLATIPGPRRGRHRPRALASSATGCRTCSGRAGERRGRDDPARSGTCGCGSRSRRGIVRGRRRGVVRGAPGRRPRPGRRVRLRQEHDAPRHPRRCCPPRPRSPRARSGWTAWTCFGCAVPTSTGCAARRSP